MPSMSPPDSYSDMTDPDAPQRRARQRPTNYTPLFLTIAMLVGVILAASFIFNKKNAMNEEGPSGPDQPNPEFIDPFAKFNQVSGDDLYRDLVGEVGPNIIDAAPPELDHRELFQSAMRRADRGIALKDEALAARDAGNDAEYDRLGRQAFQTLDAAFKSVRDWELTIIDQYSSKDGQVRAIIKEITRWKKARDKFIKLPGIVDSLGSADRE
tara:strand:- start:2023 stop:2658 length:636 start_codon:yes stop_codon:yes gene_type:complete